MVIIEDTRQQNGKHDIKHNWFVTHGISLVRCKLPFGDYAPPPKVSIDTKRSIDEIAENIGNDHVRFKSECKAAQEAGCRLIVLVENDLGITDVSQVHTWENPRSVYSSRCIQGPRLQKAMETMHERYGVIFMFCTPEESAERILELLNEQQTT